MSAIGGAISAANVTLASGTTVLVNAHWPNEQLRANVGNLSPQPVIEDDRLARVDYSILGSR